MSNHHDFATESASLAHLEGLLGHLSAYSGLYSKNTFLQLYSGIVRMIRQYRLKGLVFQRLHGDSAFKTISLVLDSVDDVQVFDLDNDLSATGTKDTLQQTGFLIALTNQFCATLHWSCDAEDVFQTLQGGWTFHPGDCKTAALYLADMLENPTELKALIEQTPLDRRYDEKQTWFITQLIANLESRNRDLAVALKQVKTLHQQMVDQERLAAIGQLCSVIAHEIRNPLGLIDLYAKLIEAETAKLPEGVDTSKLGSHLQLIRESTQSLEGILSELTQYARPMTLETASVDVGQVVGDVVAMYEPKAAEMDVTLSLTLPETPLTLTLDERRIKQALINLIKNALEVSKAGSQIRVVVATRQGDDQVFIKVTDQGPGVDEKYRQKLFTPYFSTKGNGTGLGLAHSRKILQTHGGTVTLLSSSAQGSTFALVLPLSAPPAPGDSSSLENPAGVSLTSPSEVSARGSK